MKYLHALNKIEGIGAQKLRTLISAFGTAQNVWQSDLASLKQTLGQEKLAEKIFWEKQKINVNSEWEKLQKYNIRITSFTDKNYPTLLKQIHNPPYLLYSRGNLDLNDSPTISIVGSRKFSAYGEQVAKNLSHDLAKAGFIVVSGLALGIDAISHRGTLDAKGKTVAVLGSSVDDANIYPRTNFNLAQEIIAHEGLLLSDYPPETPATNMTFPARNRIVAGLSLGTIIIEAGEKSGALITAHMALENNREVFSVPGSILSPTSIGTNNLIKKSSAKIITCVEDVLEEFDFLKSPETKQATLKIPDNDKEAKLLTILSDVPKNINQIAKESALDVSKISATLTMMEIKGWTKNLGGQNYILL